MTFTEDDLRDVLTARERTAIEPDRVLEGVRAAVARRRGRRTTMVAAAVAITVAGLGVSLVYLTGNHGRADPGATRGTRETGLLAEPAPLSSRPALGFTLSDKDIGGLPVSAIEASATRQFAYMWTQPGPPAPNSVAVSLWMFEPGAYQPKMTGEVLEVAGRHGYFGMESYPEGDKRGVVPPQPSLTWQYTDGAWAVLQGGFDQAVARKELLAIAARITLEQPRHARLPYHVGYLPPQMQATTVIRTPDTVELRLTESGRQALSINVSDGAPSGMPTGPWQPNTTVAGHPAFVSSWSLIVDFGSFNLQLGVLPDADIPVEELTRIATTMTFADWSNPTTWFDATDAVR
jgi:hypothetical protein